jgi:hypothetical protein
VHAKAIQSDWQTNCSQLFGKSNISPHLQAEARFSDMLYMTFVTFCFEIVFIGLLPKTLSTLMTSGGYTKSLPPPHTHKVSLGIKN